MARAGFFTTAVLALAAVACGHEPRTPQRAGVYVFGQLAHAGDANSFHADARWPRLTVGAGRTSEVHLVIVAHEVQPGSVRTVAALAAREADGTLFTLDAMRTVASSARRSFRVDCVLRDTMAC